MKSKEKKNNNLFRYLTIISVSFLLLVVSSKSINAQIAVSVNTSDVIATDVKDKYGINLNAGVDHDVNRAEGARSLVDALKETGVKRLRYPGGNKSNYFVWTDDINNPDPKTNRWEGWYAGEARETLNFDQFMGICQETDAMPHINVMVNVWKPLQDNVDMAAAWVKYANVTKGYNVKYWEIGNELWQMNWDQWSSIKLDLPGMVEMVKAYSAAMKAVDPTIKIGVSYHENQMEALANACGDALDFAAISGYTDGGGADYSGYREYQDANLIWKAKSYLPIKTVISEFNQANWSWDSWDSANNTGKGLMNFDLIGQIFKNSMVEYGCLWNTRWYPSKEGVYGRSKWDAFDNLNNPYPIIQPFILWQKFLQDDLVKISSDSKYIITYASYEKNSNALSVFLINKSNESKDVNLQINGLSGYVEAEVWQYKGEDELDESPTMGEVGTTTLSQNKVDYTLPGTSITVFKLNSGSANMMIKPSAAGTYKINQAIEFKFGTTAETKSVVVYDGNGNKIGTALAPDFSFNYTPTVIRDEKFKCQFKNANSEKIGDDYEVTISMISDVVIGMILPEEGQEYLIGEEIQITFNPPADAARLYVYNTDWSKEMYMGGPDYTLSFTPTELGPLTFHWQFITSSWVVLHPYYDRNITIVSELSTSIEDNENDQKRIKLLSDSNKDIIRLDISQLNSQSIINIYSMSGRKVKYLQLQQGIHDINVSDLEKGIYILSVKNKEAGKVFKFCKQ